MRRRKLVAAIGVLALLVALTIGAAAMAQSAITVGLLSLHSSEHERSGKIGASAFRAGMKALGYGEGREFHLHERHADGDAARLPSLAAELLAERVDVIVAVGTDATHAARAATSSLPIVMAGVGDPVRAGFVFSLPFPGGNVTGTALLNPETAGKQLELLREAAPALRKVALLRRRSGSHDRTVESLRSTAAALGVTLSEIIVMTADDLPRAFEEMRRLEADGFLVLANPALDDMRNEVAELALRYRVPGAGWQSYHVAAGYLLSYGPSLSEMHARAANYVDKIARGRSPGDLPVEQAERFALAVNLRTAKALGLTIPPTLLARADEVIE
jgi:putative tryptophan/tyrosine transport system substrate-binding protein